MPVPALTSSALSTLGGIRHAFFTRAGGVSAGVYESLNSGVGSHDAPENVSENRARMAAALRVAPSHLLTAYQVHSPTVVEVERPWSHAERPRADAIVTRTPSLAIGVSTADCGPVLFADPRAQVIGAAHAGWRGALSGVLETTVIAMERRGADRGRIVAALGPTISQANYEVGPDLLAQFIDADPANTRFFRPAERAGHFYFNLPGYITARLTAAAVETVEDISRCTYAEPEQFYSYRRATHRGEPDYGRHVNAIALVE